MKQFRYIWFVLLGIYSTVLIFIEIQVSQEFVRNFFTDITGPVPFYAVNTSLSVFLLLATALVFAVCLVCIEGDEQSKTKRNFYWSQILIFSYLACDDRFLFHEKLGVVLGGENALIINALIILSFGVLEVLLILSLGNLRGRSKQAKKYIFTAAVLFGITVVIDGLFPSEMVPRLSLEDLSKTWANTFLFLFAWDIFCNHIAALKQKARGSQFN